MVKGFDPYAFVMVSEMYEVLGEGFTDEKKNRRDNNGVKRNSSKGNIRVDIINMLEKSQSGHPGGSLSAVEILTTLYFKRK